MRRADAEEGIRSATLKPPISSSSISACRIGTAPQIIERLRSWSNVPIIVLTVRSREREKVRLLELGADDYVVKPFGIAELIARARAALRPHRAAPPGDPVVRVGAARNQSCHPRRVTLDGKRLVLGPKEYLVLQILAQHAGKVVTRQQIMKHVWGGSHLDDTHYLRIVVRNLRKKDRGRPDPAAHPVDRARRRLSARRVRCGATSPGAWRAEPPGDLRKIYARFTSKILAALRPRCLAFPPTPNASHGAKRF